MAGLSICLFGWDVHRVYLSQILPIVGRGENIDPYSPGWNSDSVTRARLHAVVDRGYEEDPAVDPKVAEYLHISEAFEHAARSDLIHSHYDFIALSYTRR